MRNVIYITPSAHGTTIVTNYDAANTRVNDFLRAFDIWNCHGFLICNNGNNIKVQFECDKEFFDLSMTQCFKQAFRRLGVEVTYDGNAALKLE